MCTYHPATWAVSTWKDSLSSRHLVCSRPVPDTHLLVTRARHTVAVWVIRSLSCRLPVPETSSPPGCLVNTSELVAAAAVTLTAAAATLFAAALAAAAAAATALAAAAAADTLCAVALAAVAAALLAAVLAAAEFSLILPFALVALLLTVMRLFIAVWLCRSLSCPQVTSRSSSSSGYAASCLACVPPRSSLSSSGRAACYLAYWPRRARHRRLAALRAVLPAGLAALVIAVWLRRALSCLLATPHSSLPSDLNQPLDTIMCWCPYSRSHSLY